MNIKDELQKPFPESEIEWRVQSCGLSNGNPWVMVLAYVQARAIQRRLDEVFGWDGWTDEYRAVEGNMICRLGVKTDDGWIYKENGASETQVEGFKGGISSALKRVAASGYGIGRYLYNLEESFAECQLEKPKNMHGWEKTQTKDKQYIYWKIPTLPEWALPKSNSDTFKPSKEQINELNNLIKSVFEDTKKEEIEAVIKTVTGKEDSKHWTKEDYDKVINYLEIRLNSKQQTA